MGTAALLEMEAPSAPAIYGDTEVLAEGYFLYAVALATDIQTLTGILHAHALHIVVFHRSVSVLISDGHFLNAADYGIEVDFQRVHVYWSICTLNRECVFEPVGGTR